MASSSQATRRKKAELIWVISVLLYVIVRFLVAYGTLHRYGLNVWIFGFLDIATAVPYAIGTARLVTSLADHNLQGAARWAILSAVSFLAPYLYIAIAGRDKHMPILVWVVLAVLVLSLAVNATMSVRRKVKLNVISDDEAGAATGVSPDNVPDAAADGLVSP